MEYTKVAANVFEKLQMNAGVVVDAFTPSSGVIGNILGVTTGGLSIATNPEYIDFGEDMDNVPGSTWQLKRVMSYDPVLSGTFLTLTGSLAKQLSGGGTLEDGQIIPATELTEDDFEDIWLVGDFSAINEDQAVSEESSYLRRKAGFCAVHIMNTMNTTGFQWQTSKDAKGQFSFEFHGHYDLTDIDTVPFEIYVKRGASTRLKSLSLSGFNLDPAFDPDITEYEATPIDEMPEYTVVAAELESSDAEFSTVDPGKPLKCYYGTGFVNYALGAEIPMERTSGGSTQTLSQIETIINCQGVSYSTITITINSAE